MTKRKLCAVFAALGLMVSVMSGCVRMAVGLDIREDGSADISYEAGVSNELYEMLARGGEENPFDDIKQQAQEYGYTLQEYDKDGYKGVILRRSVDDLEQASLSDPYIEGISFKKEKGVLKYIMRLSGDIGSVQSLKQNIGDEQADLSQFDIKLTVTAPYPITSSNAQQVSEDGRTATWDLMTAETIDMVCEGDVRLLGLPVTAALCIVSGLAVLAVVIVAVGAARKRKRERRYARRRPNSMDFTDGNDAD